MSQQDLMHEAALQQSIGQMATGYWTAQSLRVAVKLGIADYLKENSLSAESLAEKAQVQSEPLYRVLRALSSAGLFEEDRQGNFSLTESGQLLREDHPRTQRNFILMITGGFYRAWENLEYAVRTGNPAFDETYGMPAFDYLAKHPEEAKLFDAAMTGIHGAETQPMIEAYDFSVFGTIADIGGGNGSTLSGILNHYPQPKGILFDLPHVSDRSKVYLADKGLGNRVEVHGGDFFKFIPQGADAYLFRHILHDWSDEDACQILKVCRKSMKPDSKVLIVETVIPEGNGPCFGKWLDLMMLVIGGKERSGKQYQTLLESAGLRLNNIIPTDAEISIVEAVAV
ncbi:MAG: hypothetical protein KDK34_13070 [Leptospiraceae bacterium]|nr:hypothetical protein [Leptospiraceae bacterium]